MKFIIIVLIGSTVIATAEVLLSVNFRHWYDRIIFDVLAGLYGMVLGYVLFKD